MTKDDLKDKTKKRDATLDQSRRVVRLSSFGPPPLLLGEDQQAYPEGRFGYPDASTTGRPQSFGCALREQLKNKRSMIVGWRNEPNWGSPIRTDAGSTERRAALS
jgi:hypothetical protein